MEAPWSVSYTRHAIEFLKTVITSERVLRKIFKYRALLQETPDLGRMYDPEYPAARPPFPCRYIPIPDTPFTLYYLKDDEKREIVIFSIDFQRTDPNARFSSFDWECIDW